jgi:hypothetical protein
MPFFVALFLKVKSNVKLITRTISFFYPNANSLRKEPY